MGRVGEGGAAGAAGRAAERKGQRRPGHEYSVWSSTYLWGRGLHTDVHVALPHLKLVERTREITSRRFEEGHVLSGL